MKQPLISVIVPIYKVELFLNKCIDSIVNQTYKNLEIILVDDGSPDNCGKICDEYAKNDSRIRVIHKQNGGLSSARNSGLDIAKGEYIAFVDSDDYIEKEYIQELLSLIEKDNTKLAICSVQKVDENGNKLNSNDYNLDNCLVAENEKFDLLCRKVNVPYVIAWNKLYHKDIWKSLRYPVGKIHEDEYVIWSVFNAFSGGISLTDKKLYNYFIRIDSITTTKTPSKKMFDAIDAFKHRQSIISKDSKYYPIIVNKLLASCCAVYDKIKSDKTLKKELIDILKNEYKENKHYLKTKLKLKVILILRFGLLYDIIRKIKR